MNKTDVILEGASIIDEVFKNRGRQNIIGTFVTGMGLTIVAVGVTILMNKPSESVPKLEQNVEKTE